MPAVNDRTATIGTMPVFWREAPVSDGAPPLPLYLHGVPTNSDDWLPFLRAPAPGARPAGFGRTGKAGNPTTSTATPTSQLPTSSRSTRPTRRARRAGLASAQRHPERVARLVIVNALPFRPVYRWHRPARLWRTPLLGELAMGATTRTLMRYGTREARPEREPMPDAWLDTVFDHFDQGTQRAILRLYRSGSSDVLAAAGARLQTLTMPALVVWGQADPYIPARFGRAFAQALPDAELLELTDAGHWPWFDRPDLVDRVADFLGAAVPPASVG
jgi:pimeloyl-ACP methyl ester carboxylesterase